jgi:hypothetical protein
MRTRAIAALVFSLLASHGVDSWAGRPLNSDDASTAELGTCQVENWLEGTGSERAMVVAPACGVIKDLELGFDYTLPAHKDVLRASSGVALKWVPESWRVNTVFGEVNFGIKLSAAFEHPANAAWRNAGTAALVLSSLKLGEDWAAHANLGAARDRASSSTATLMNLSLVWTPTESSLLFAETQTNSRREIFGGTISTVGARWWLVKDSFGIDISASREAGSANPTQWSFGFGWYGLKF